MARIALVFLMGGLLIGASRCDDDEDGDDGSGEVGEGEGSAGSSGGGGEECGDVTCDRGEVCCNESCGICTEPGGFCTEQFCTDEEPGGGSGNAPFCGGIAGIRCPGAGECVDDPTDDCDPENGGADCGGLCECNALGLCVAGHTWNGSPEVCGCEPSESGGDGVQCGPSTCAAGEVCCNESCGICTEPGGVCTEQFCGEPGDEDEGEPCGSSTCAAGQVCCNASCGICTEPDGFCTQQACDDDDPPGEEEPRPGQPCELQCDPGQHCEYVEVQCIQAPCPPQPECVDDTRCGGFAGFGCPGAGDCVDDPNDDCDPENGGADCGGICECNALGNCPDGNGWNSSPSVCACNGDPAGGGEECGNVTCPDGQLCCNASCGICAPPDGACIQIACL